MHSSSRSFKGFAVVSGCGWAMDVGITMALVHAGAPPLLASIVGASAAVTFVYFVSLRAIFEVGGRLGARGFPFYIVWQVIAVSAASVLVAALASLLEPSATKVLKQVNPSSVAESLTWASGAAKALVTPLTLLANFLFMRWLTQRLHSVH